MDRNTARLCLLVALASHPSPAARAQQAPDRSALLTRMQAHEQAGYKAHRRGALPQALQEYQAALALARRLGHRGKIAALTGSLGVIHRQLGHYRKALELQQSALALERAQGNRAGEARALNNIGVLYQRQGQYAQALEFLRRALALKQALADRASEAYTLGALGDLHRKLGQYAKALEFHRRALEIRQKLGHRAGEAGTLASIGLVHRMQGQHAQALEHLQQAMTLYRKLGDRAGEATALGNIGLVHQNLGQYEKALDLQRGALALKQKLGDRPGQAVTLGNLGLCLESLGRYPEALEFHLRALALKEKLGNRASEAKTLGDLGGICLRLARYARALHFLQRSLALMRELGNRAGEAIALNSIGIVHRRLGQYGQALEHQRRALALMQAVGNRAGEATTLGNIALSHQNMGQFAEAIAFQQQALALAQKLGDRVREALMLGNLGVSHELLGHHRKSIALQQRALALERELGNPAGEARALGNIASVLHGLGRYDEALDHQQRALTLCRKLGDQAGEANALRNLGATCDSLGRHADALGHLQRALALHQALGDRAGEASTLGNLGWIDEQAGRYAEALERHRQAARVRGRLLRSAGAGRSTLLQEMMFDLEFAARLGFERARAGEPGALDLALQLLDLRRGWRFLAGGDPVPELEASRRIDGEIGAIEQAVSQAGSEQQRRTLIDRRTALEERQAREIARIRASDSVAASVYYPEPPRLAEVQQVLGPGETLLVYFLPGFAEESLAVQRGRSRRARRQVSECWVAALSQRRAQVVRIGGDQFKTEQINRLLQLYRRALEQSRVGYPAAAFARLAHRLHALLLAPVLEPGQGHVIVAPDGLLHTVPLAPLVTLAGGTAYPELPYLARRRSLSRVQSLSHLLSLRRAQRSGNGKGLVAFADPPGANLPGARREVERIAALFEPPLRRVYQGAEASERRASLAATYAGARVIHFATHATIAADPLESSIWLAPGDGADGRLRGREILANLRRVDAELVVLSACRTARAALLRGEGPASLARIFQVAGPASMLASLWRVGDRATAELMPRFYRERIERGASRAEALRRAQVALVRSGDLAAPGHWGAFTLLGDSR